MSTSSSKPFHWSGASRLSATRERRDEFVVARHFVEVTSDRNKKESYLVEDVFIVKVGRRFKARDEAWEFAYTLAGWGYTTNRDSQRFSPTPQASTFR
jgi:hypothetical protein